jgi:hypothetical protein
MPLGPTLRSFPPPMPSSSPLPPPPTCICWTPAIHPPTLATAPHLYLLVQAADVAVVLRGLLIHLHGLHTAVGGLHMGTQTASSAKEETGQLLDEWGVPCLCRRPADTANRELLQGTQLPRRPSKAANIQGNTCLLSWSWLHPELAANLSPLHACGCLQAGMGMNAAIRRDRAACTSADLC